MKTKIAGMGAIAAVALAGVATAKTNTLTGAFIDDPASSISVKVALKKSGKPKALKSVTATYTEVCVTELNGDVTYTESVATKTVPGSFKIKNVNGDYRFDGATPVGEDNYSYKITGKVDKKGKHATGSLSAYWTDPENPTAHYCNKSGATNWNADK